MTQPTLKMPLWLIHPRGGLPVLLGLATAVALAGFFLPTEPSTLAYGQVTGFGVSQGARRAYLKARLRVDGRPAVVGLPRGHGCVVGARIELRRVTYAWGVVYRTAPDACAG